MMVFNFVNRQLGHYAVILGLLLCVPNAQCKDDVCYGECGCFDLGYPFDTLPVPESPAAQELSWKLYTPENKQNGIDISFKTIPKAFNKTLPTKLLIHGWITGPSFMHNLRDSYLLKANLAVNVIVLNWKEGARRLLYFGSVSNTRVAGACSGALLRRLVTDRGASYDDMQCIGHSLGAHTCGFAGKFLKSKLARITGTEPAGPLFRLDDSRGRLHRSDAVFVDAVQTTANKFFRIGMSRAVGDVSFFPNSGGSQPGCLTVVCDHNIALDYYAASVAKLDECQFNAFPCKSQDDADDNKCETCREGECQRFGHFADTMPGRGEFFLRTKKKYPYCTY